MIDGSTATLAALLAAIGWGSYLVPLQRQPGPWWANLAPMGLGMGVLALIALLLNSWSSSWGAMAVLLLSGVVWAGGNALSIVAARALGLSRAVPIFNVSIAVNAIWGIAIFHEASGSQALAAVAVALVLSFIGVVLVAGKPSDRPPGPGAAKRPVALAAAVVTGCLFGSYNAVARLVVAGPADTTSGMVLGAGLTTTVIAAVLLARGPRRGAWPDFRAGVGAGFLWALATGSSLVAISVLGLLRSFPILMISAPIYSCWGILYFREASRAALPRLVGGTALLLIAAGIVVAALGR